MNSRWSAIRRRARDLAFLAGVLYLSPGTILEAMPSLRLARFDAVDQNGNLRLDANPDDFVHDQESLGLFELTKDEFQPSGGA